MDKTFSNTFRKAFTVAAFVSLAVMAAVTGVAIFQLCVTGQRYARLRNYATERGIKLTGSSDKPLFSIKSGSAPSLAERMAERLDGTYGLSDCSLEIRGESLLFTGKLTGGFSLTKTAFPFVGSDESDDSDKYDPCSDYYGGYYYNDKLYNRSAHRGSRETGDSVRYAYTENGFRERHPASETALDEATAFIRQELKSALKDVRYGYYCSTKDYPDCKIQVALSNELNYDGFIQEDFAHLKDRLGRAQRFAGSCLYLFLFCMASVLSFLAGTNMLVRCVSATLALCVASYLFGFSAACVVIFFILFVVASGIIKRSRNEFLRGVAYIALSLLLNMEMMKYASAGLDVGTECISRFLAFTFSAINIIACACLVDALRTGTDTLEIFPARKKTDGRIFIELSPSLLPYMTTICEKLNACHRNMPNEQCFSPYDKPCYNVVCREELEGNEYRIVKDGECLASKLLDTAELDDFELNLLVCRAIAARVDRNRN